MISLGIVEFQNDAKSSWHKAVAQYGQQKGVQVYHFSPFDIKKGGNTIFGRAYDKQTNMWDKRTFPLPQFIYDRCFYRPTKASKIAWQRVQHLKVKTTFIGYGLPNKWRVYNALQEEDNLKPFLPYTKLASAKTIQSMLRRFKTVIVKPVYGSQGRDIYQLTQNGNHLTIRNRNHEEKQLSTLDTQNNQQLRFLHDEPYIIQPYLQLTTEDHHPYDLRILLQKDGFGQWTELGRGVRCAPHSQLTSNLHTGGVVYDWQKWKEIYTDTTQEKLEYVIESLNTKLLYQLDRSFPPLFEIGIDIGITLQGDVYLLEVNSKPGYETIRKIGSEQQKTIAYQNLIDYCLFLNDRNLPRKHSERGDHPNDPHSESEI
ncbi:YheC/YheD family protein [Texcoconibacillus texcoconensis]|uniref:Glutathione synthase/RimK-type ligase-like ATP-grasp enzyme n=1 Tax=Texcoconibacillus texcoconensis TaxID=1095777 RepID=A0A840QPH1_9BACI|nr:YheC/YheD family protein [Texcoconibacillus texcoconensis]MBB5173259.1 glutathione synthase/RimK-type ligase-like ATP-grasp enzyme [Texcoconibacillus texcoconensis]